MVTMVKIVILREPASTSVSETHQYVLATEAVLQKTHALVQKDILETNASCQYVSLYQVAILMFALAKENVHLLIHVFANQDSTELVVVLQESVVEYYSQIQQYVLVEDNVSWKIFASAKQDTPVNSAVLPDHAVA